MITVQNLSVCFSQQVVLETISIRFLANQVTYLMGKSGSGKSVFLKALMGLVPISQGKIIYHDVKPNKEQPLSTMLKGELYSQVGFVLQTPFLLEGVPIQTILDWIRPKVPHFSINYFLDFLELQLKILSKKPEVLSFSERKKVAMLFQLVRKPKVLLLDEPTTGLEPKFGLFLSERLYQLKEITKCTVLIVSHDLNFAARHSDRIVFLSEGKIVEDIKSNLLLESQNSLVKQFTQCYEHF